MSVFSNQKGFRQQSEQLSVKGTTSRGCGLQWPPPSSPQTQYVVHGTHAILGDIRHYFPMLLPQAQQRAFSYSFKKEHAVPRLTRKIQAANALMTHFIKNVFISIQERFDGYQIVINTEKDS